MIMILKPDGLLYISFNWLQVDSYTGVFIIKNWYKMKSGPQFSCIITPSLTKVRKKVRKLKREKDSTQIRKDLALDE